MLLGTTGLGPGLQFCGGNVRGRQLSLHVCYDIGALPVVTQHASNTEPPYILAVLLPVCESRLCPFTSFKTAFKKLFLVQLSHKTVGFSVSWGTCLLVSLASLKELQLASEETNNISALSWAFHNCVAAARRGSYGMFTATMLGLAPFTNCFLNVTISI